MKNFGNLILIHFPVKILTRSYLVMPVSCNFLTLVGLHDLREPMPNLDPECRGVLGITLPWNS